MAFRKKWLLPLGRLERLLDKRYEEKLKIGNSQKTSGWELFFSKYLFCDDYFFDFLAALEDFKNLGISPVVGNVVLLKDAVPAMKLDGFICHLDSNFSTVPFSHLLNSTRGSIG